MDISPRRFILFLGLTPLLSGVTFSSALSIDSQYPEVPSSDNNLPVCYMQTPNGIVVNLNDICKEYLEQSVPSQPTLAPSSKPALVPAPEPTVVPEPEPTVVPEPEPYIEPAPAPT